MMEMTMTRATRMIIANPMIDFYEYWDRTQSLIPQLAEWNQAHAADAEARGLPTVI